MEKKEDSQKLPAQEKKRKRTPSSSFKELSPVFPSGTLVKVSENVYDSIIFFIVPAASMDPKRFLKSRDIKYCTSLTIKAGDLLNYLGTYKNIIGKKSCIYHRFLYETKIVYVFDDMFYSEDLKTIFVDMSSEE